MIIQENIDQGNITIKDNLMYIKRIVLDKLMVQWRCGTLTDSFYTLMKEFLYIYKREYIDYRPLYNGGLSADGEFVVELVKEGE